MVPRWIPQGSQNGSQMGVIGGFLDYGGPGLAGLHLERESENKHRQNKIKEQVYGLMCLMVVIGLLMTFDDLYDWHDVCMIAIPFYSIEKCHYPVGLRSGDRIASPRNTRNTLKN